MQMMMLALSPASASDRSSSTTLTRTIRRQGKRYFRTKNVNDLFFLKKTYIKKACLDFCRSTTGCQFFTHYGGDYNYCLAFADCEETGPCPDGIECYYGEDTCDGEYLQSRESGLPVCCLLLCDPS